MIGCPTRWQAFRVQCSQCGAFNTIDLGMVQVFSSALASRRFLIPKEAHPVKWSCRRDRGQPAADEAGAARKPGAGSWTAGCC